MSCEKKNGQINVLVFDGTKWSSVTPVKSSGKVSLADSHTLAVDSTGKIYATFSIDGIVYCLRSSDNGKTWDAKAPIDPNGKNQSVPVIGIKKDGTIVAAWQDGRESASAIRYAISSDNGATWSVSHVLSASAKNQTMPDMVIADDTLYFSYLEAGKAIFERRPQPVISKKNHSTKNIFPNSGFEHFSGDLPSGWTFDSWNQEFMQEKFGKTTPGRDGKGSCLEFKKGSPIASLKLLSSRISVKPNTEYVFKGYYASTCKKVVVTGRWFDSDNKAVGTFKLVLPETQDGWIDFFKEVSCPVKGKTLQVEILKKWQDGRVRFDDFSLREGFLRDYASEFSLQTNLPLDQQFPIFAWLPPTYWRHFGKRAKEFDKDKYHAEYALANFTVGLRSKFGIRRYVPYHGKDDAELIELGKDPSVWVISGGDEPRKDKFAKLAKIRQKLSKLAPSKPFWVNLLPTYGFGSYAAYRDYIRGYISTVKPSMFTYDHYALGGKGHDYGRSWFANLEILRRQTLKSNIDFGVIALVVAHGGMRSPNEAELRWQAYSSLAYGARSLGWFTYLTEIQYGGWNWHDAVIDPDGHRTRHYSMLRRLNGDVLKLGPTLLKLKSTGVFHTAPLPELTKDIKESRLIKSIGTGQWLIGEFTDKAGKNYLMLVNRNFTKEQTTKLTFRDKFDGLFEISKATGKKERITNYIPAEKTATFTLTAGNGRLFCLE